MLKAELQTRIDAALTTAQADLSLPAITELQSVLNIERPKQVTFGDYAINVSALAKWAKQSPLKIAETIAAQSSLAEWQPSVTGGFINFTLPETTCLQALTNLLNQPQPGQSQRLSDQTILLEFVSANPTGPLHIGHGRWVALGDSLGRMLRHAGAHVTNEFYINDAGLQIRNLAQSVWYRSLELLGTGGKLPDPPADKSQPYPFYPGEYVIDIAEAFIAHQGKDAVLGWDNAAHQPPEAAITAITAFAKDRMLAEQEALMARCGLTFDVWFSERTLHDSGAVEAILEALKASGTTYEQEGALWFASSRFGDDQDRVLIKSDGKYTYLTADIAYHHEKFRREEGCYNRFINIWGADHHGYIARMKAALTALGHDPDKLEILLGQLVNLVIDGERTRMGKRKKMLTLADLVDEVGVDAVRFWMVSKSQDTALDFNVALASSKTDENPVFYAQYAHARCCSIIRNAFQPRMDTVDQKQLPPLLNQTDWEAWLKTVSPVTLSCLFDEMASEEARSELKQLILFLDGFEDRVCDAARQRLPHLVARYALDLSAMFHRFYNVCRILTSDTETTRLRLTLIEAVRRVLATSLDLMGVSAPEQM